MWSAIDPGTTDDPVLRRKTGPLPTPGQRISQTAALTGQDVHVAADKRTDRRRSDKRKRHRSDCGHFGDTRRWRSQPALNAL